MGCFHLKFVELVLCHKVKTITPHSGQSPVVSKALLPLRPTLLQSRPTHPLRENVPRAACSGPPCWRCLPHSPLLAADGLHITCAPSPVLLPRSHLSFRETPLAAVWEKLSGAPSRLPLSAGTPSAVAAHLCEPSGETQPTVTSTLIFPAPCAVLRITGCPIRTLKMHFIFR